MAKIFQEYQLFWGDSHFNLHGKGWRVPWEEVDKPEITGGRLKKILDAAKEHLDFLPMAYYPMTSYVVKGCRVESKGNTNRILDEWRLVQEVVADYNSPHEFVTFLGYEWHGNRTRYGDHNVYYLKDYEHLDDSETLPMLYENLRKSEAIAIPHHTGYQVGVRGKDWDFHEDDLSPFVEIYSGHGSSEGCNTPFPMTRLWTMGPRVSGGTVQEGLKRGHRLGIIASGDNGHLSDYPGVWGRGLMAVYAKELTRESLWDAFMNRRVYGVTGDRIKLRFSVNGHIMGEVFSSKNSAQILVEVIGGHAIDRIEIIRNGRVLHTYCHSGKWTTPQTTDPIRAKVRIRCGWGPRENMEKTWHGSLEVVDGRIVSIEPCFEYFGQRIDHICKNKCNWVLTTRSRIIDLWGLKEFQGMIFEIEAPLKSRILLRTNSKDVNFTLEEALEKSRVVALIEEAKEQIRKQFGLSSEEVRSICERERGIANVFYNKAWKTKIYKAIPEGGYHVKFRFTDSNPVKGQNYYYIRVSQLNGQMAWSSPIWMNFLNQAS